SQPQRCLVLDGDDAGDRPREGRRFTYRVLEEAGVVALIERERVTVAILEASRCAALQGDVVERLAVAAWEGGVAEGGSETPRNSALLSEGRQRSDSEQQCEAGEESVGSHRHLEPPMGIREASTGVVRADERLGGPYRATAGRSAGSAT